MKERRPPPAVPPQPSPSVQWDSLRRSFNKQEWAVTWIWGEPLHHWHTHTFFCGFPPQLFSCFQMSSQQRQTENCVSNIFDKPNLSSLSVLTKSDFFFFLFFSSSLSEKVFWHFFEHRTRRDRSSRSWELSQDYWFKLSVACDCDLLLTCSAARASCSLLKWPFF